MPSWQTSPVGNVSLSGPIGAPFRFTATGVGEDGHARARALIDARR